MPKKIRNKNRKKLPKPGHPGSAPNAGSRPQSQARLDAEELVAIAAKAMAADQDRIAMEKLQAALEIDPTHAGAAYMLGAMYAHLRDNTKAIEWMARALELKPDFHDVRFQLGLLYVGNRQANMAEVMWMPLEKLDPEHPLKLFARGVGHMLHDRFAECITHLETGIANNKTNPSLNREMSRYVEAARNALAGKTPTTAPQNPS
ncbi:hypothetical protein MK489_18300 [Myxococcota bacterium]|nr:hypothetical protein [Myxococcota bacterium]